MKTGDKVRVVTIPHKLPDGELHTASLFQLCLGQIFPIVEVQGGLLELEVGEVLGQKAYMHSIWIEPEHVELVEGSPGRNESPAIPSRS